MSEAAEVQKVMELKPDYIRALNVAFGETKLPPVLEKIRPWSEMRELIDGYLPCGFRPDRELPPAEPRAGEFADLYYRSGHSLDECKTLLGKGEGSPRGFNLSFHHRIADALGISIKEAGHLLTQFRVEKTCELWRPWQVSLMNWLSGAPMPKPYTVNFHENVLQAATLFERLNVPWRYLVRESAGPLTLTPARVFGEATSHETLPFMLEVRSGENLLNAYCLADSHGKRYVPKIENWRSILGPAGHFSRLLVGDGPVCLKTAFEPRTVHQIDRGDGIDKIAILLAEGRCDTSHQVYVPKEFQGTKVRPFVPLSALRSGAACEHFDLYAYHERSSSDPVTVPVASYFVESKDRRITKVGIEQHLGHLANWAKQGARQLDMLHAKRWLAKESDTIPRLEPLFVSEAGIFEGGEATGRTRRHVNFMRHKLPVPKSYEGSWVFPRLIELNGARLLELVAYPGMPQLLKTFKYDDGRLLVSTPLGM